MGGVELVRKWQKPSTWLQWPTVRGNHKEMADTFLFYLPLEKAPDETVHVLKLEVTFMLDPRNETATAVISRQKCTHLQPHRDLLPPTKV